MVIFLLAFGHTSSQYSTTQHNSNNTTHNQQLPQHHFNTTNTTTTISMVGATSGASSAAATTMSLSNHSHTESGSTMESLNHFSTTTTSHSRDSQPQYPLRTASPLSVVSDQSSSTHGHEEDDDDLEESSWDSEDFSSDDYEADTRRTRPAGPHLVIDSDTMRLPSGRIISSRPAVGGSTSSNHMRRRQQRRASPQLLEEDLSQNDLNATYNNTNTTAAATPHDNADRSQGQIPPMSRSASPETALVSTTTTTTTPETSLSKRETKRRALTTQLASRMRQTDQQTLARLPHAEQRSLLVTGQRAVEQAQREGQRFTGKMDSLGNIQVSERFVNDVPGGKAHKNRFFAR
ncbi:uncharacterized protein B0I36DRAFT_352813 [Microdochium trichocladiopsis]|uniref:Uncharacterized protein n=1 Tax=Microdochium trichocladiopsis TaxID=1682393 RepID=A0A9P9BLN4_9PEZI|nr:uncharacterized protein B0I36DRAFT_352813 [Microdochium trichocladiopsis]KAH7024595.1 hypothetical protein B0I36DRAFT_352813 [Microdochium trichocladiopsis]